MFDCFFLFFSYGTKTQGFEITGLDSEVKPHLNPVFCLGYIPPSLASDIMLLNLWCALS